MSSTTGGEIYDNSTVKDILNALNSTSSNEKNDLYPILTERTVLHCILWPLIIVIGIVGNSMTMIVICRLKESTTSSLFLMMLALSDTTTLCIRGIYTVYAWGQIYFPQEVLGWTFTSYSAFKLSHIPERISKAITVLIVIERVLAVAMPFKFRSVCTRKRAICAIIAITVVILGTSLPYNIDLMQYEYNTESQIREYPMIQKDARQYFKNRLHKSTSKMVHETVNRVIFDFLPIPVIAICNIVLITSLSRSKPVSSESRRSKERNLTRLLLAVSFCFLALCGPFDFYSLFLLTNLITFSNDILLMSEVFKTTTLMNSSINFIIYVVMCPKYREGYRKLMVCHCKKEDREEDKTGQNISLPVLESTRY